MRAASRIVSVGRFRVPALLLMVLAVPAAASEVADLTGKLRDEDPETRKRAAVALGRLGKKARQAIPALEKALEDPVGEVRHAAAWALERIRPKEVKKNAAALAKEGRRLFDSVEDLWKRAILENPRLTDDELKHLIGTYERGVDLYAQALEVEDKGAYPGTLLIMAKRIPSLMFEQTRRELAKRSKKHTTPRPYAAEQELKPGEKKESVSALMKAFRKAKGKERYEIAEKLGELGERAVPALTEVLSGDDKSLHAGAALALFRTGLASKTALYALMALVGDDSLEVRIDAVRTLGLIGPRAAPAVPGLVVALKDKEAGVRAEAAASLGRVGPAAKRASRILGRALRDPREEVRHRAAAALGGVGPAAATAVPALLRVLKQEDKALQTMAVEALGKIGPETSTVMPALIEQLRSHNRDVRAAAVRAVGQMGPEAKRGVSALLDLVVVEQDEKIRKAAAETLVHIGEDAVSALANALKDERPVLRWRACQILGRIGPKAQAAVSALRAALKDERSEVREAAAQALGKMGAEAKGAVSALAKVLKDMDWRVRRGAARSLGEIGPAAGGAARALAAALKDDEAEVRLAATVALGRIGPKAKAAIRALEAATQDKSEKVRKAATIALGAVRK